MIYSELQEYVIEYFFHVDIVEFKYVHLLIEHALGYLRQTTPEQTWLKMKKLIHWNTAFSKQLYQNVINTVSRNSTELSWMA